MCRDEKTARRSGLEAGTARGGKGSWRSRVTQGSFPYATPTANYASCFSSDVSCPALRQASSFVDQEVDPETGRGGCAGHLQECLQDVAGGQNADELHTDEKTKSATTRRTSTASAARFFLDIVHEFPPSIHGLDCKDC